jgi:hypothetical protein
MVFTAKPFWGATLAHAASGQSKKWKNYPADPAGSSSKLRSTSAFSFLTFSKAGSRKANSYH